MVSSVDWLKAIYGTLIEIKKTSSSNSNQNQNNSNNTQSNAIRGLGRTLS